MPLVSTASSGAAHSYSAPIALFELFLCYFLFIPTYTSKEGRSLRASTVRVHSDTSQSAAAASKRQNGNASSSHLVRRKVILAEMAQRKNLPEVRRLTQEELLAEAKITEEINKRSLGKLFLFNNAELQTQQLIDKCVHSISLADHIS